MNLEKFVAIGGLPGIHKIVSSRSNGLIIEDQHENRTRFVPVRGHQFTPLSTVGIYVETDADTLPLGDVWQRMLDQIEAQPLPPQNAASAEFRAYFDAVLPEHDRDRVHINDIKKCLKWFSFMLNKGLFAEITETEKSAETPAEEPATETVAEKTEE